MAPVICFGQQPCGIFPRRYLVAKVRTARRLQSQIGGKIVFFFHDSDHDARETKTTLRHRKSDEPISINFDYVSKTQRKFTPLYLKQIPELWHTNTAHQLIPYVDAQWVKAFRDITERKVAAFCLDMYRRMGMLEGLEVVRSSEPAFRRAACDIDDYFVDVTYEGETVRARYQQDKFLLHKGGDVFIELPMTTFGKEQISPTRDTRLRWMQSVIHCTHYICGAGEQDYLRREDAPEIEYVKRDEIDHSDEAFTELTI